MMKESKLLKSMITTLILTMLLIGIIYYRPTQINKDINANQKIATTLKIIVYDSNGIIKATMIKDDDLLTKQFISFMGGFFYGIVGNSAITAKNDAGTDKSFKIWDASTSYGGKYSDSNTGTGKKGGCIGIGTNATTATRNDYALNTKVELYTDMASNPVWDAVSGNVTMTANIAITGSRTLRESALFVKWVDGSSVEQVVCMAHDTFSSIVVVNGDFASISYIIHCHNTGFLSNFGLMLAGLFSTVADGGSRSQNFKNTANANTAIDSYGVTYTQQFYYAPLSATYQVGQIWIGTSNTAVNRADYYLGSAVEQTVSGYATIVDSTGITIHGAIVCTSARTIEEIGFGGYFRSYTFIFIRLLTGGVSIDAGDVCMVELRIDM